MKKLLTTIIMAFALFGCTKNDDLLLGEWKPEGKVFLAFGSCHYPNFIYSISFCENREGFINGTPISYYRREEKLGLADNGEENWIIYEILSLTKTDLIIKSRDSKQQYHFKRD